MDDIPKVNGGDIARWIRADRNRKFMGGVFQPIPRGVDAPSSHRPSRSLSHFKVVLGQRLPLRVNCLLNQCHRMILHFSGRNSDHRLMRWSPYTLHHMASGKGWWTPSLPLLPCRSRKHRVKPTCNRLFGAFFQYVTRDFMKTVSAGRFVSLSGFRAFCPASTRKRSGNCGKIRLQRANNCSRPYKRRDAAAL